MSLDKQQFKVWGIVFLASSCLLCFAWLIVPILAPRIMAERLAPPPYPKSQLISETQGGGSDSGCRRRVYQTNADIESVLAYMELHLPGFTRDSEAERIAYGNAIEDSSWLAQTIGSGKIVRNYPIYPSVQVSIGMLPDRETEIKITTCWAET